MKRLCYSVGLLCLTSNIIFCSLNELNNPNSDIEDSEIKYWNQLITINNARGESHIPEFESIIIKKKNDLALLFTTEEIVETQKELKKERVKGEKTTNKINKKKTDKNKKKSSKSFFLPLSPHNSQNTNNAHNETIITIQESEETIIKNAIKEHKFRLAYRKIKQIKYKTKKKELAKMYDEEYQESFIKQYNDIISQIGTGVIEIGNTFLSFYKLYSLTLISDEEKNAYDELKKVIAQILEQAKKSKFDDDGLHQCNNIMCLLNGKSYTQIREDFGLDTKEKK